MTVLIGHPTGTPFAYHAALTYLNLGVLESLCVPWMPSQQLLKLMKAVEPLKALARRFERRHFPALIDAPRVEGRGEALWRFLLIATQKEHQKVDEDANIWLMRTMERECRRRDVSAIHAYEDCSLAAFQEAKRLGKACIYDLPIGYFAQWDAVQADLSREFGAWMPPNGHAFTIDRRARKLKEIELADLVLVPSDFVADTVRRHHPNKAIAIAPYGVDLEHWKPAPERATGDTLKFLFAGQCSLRKGTPLLLEAWRAAGLKDARLDLVGPWLMTEERKAALPASCAWAGPVSAAQLRERYQGADVFVFPTYFEGRALVIAEALASGLPVITTPASGASDLVSDETGRLITVGDRDGLVDALRWFNDHRERLPQMRRAARAAAESSNWDHYRNCMARAVAAYT